MYVTHKTEDHTRWKEMKAEFKRKRQEAAASGSTSDAPVDAKKTLALSDKLKAVMVAEEGVALREFLRLKGKKPICPSCVWQGLSAQMEDREVSWISRSS